MKSIWEGARHNVLFFACPTDNLELLLRKRCKGEVFFCTALGVHFEFDSEMQHGIWELICENAVDQVIFLSAVNNVFYKQAFEKRRKCSYPVNESLAKTRKKVCGHSVRSGVFFPNIHSLVAGHLTEQIEHLLSTEYLGARLMTEQIAVEACVYDPQNEMYHSLEEIEQKGELLSNISCN